jgi:hypothetical protein
MKMTTSFSKIALCAFMALIVLSLSARSQTYLPLTGGTLTGNLYAPLFGVSASIAQPGTAGTVGFFANNSTYTFDLVSYRYGWRFIPGSDTSYPSPVFTIDQTGNTTISGNTYVAKNLGIGTTNTSGYQLAVNGNAIANSLTLQLYGTWPDYIFDKSYQLLPLTDVQAYIDKNHHLPEVPSAADVARDGMNVGPMNEVLVKKVEELTLYMIELNKQLKDQQLEITKLKKKISGKKSRIKK